MTKPAQQPAQKILYKRSKAANELHSKLTQALSDDKKWEERLRQEV